MKEKKPAQDTDKKKKVLADYKRIGTTFVPPMVHEVGPWDFTSRSSQTLPELVWWDVLIDRPRTVSIGGHSSPTMPSSAQTKCKT